MDITIPESADTARINAKLTILSGAPIVLASLHQIGSIFLVTTSLILVFKNTKIN